MATQRNYTGYSGQMAVMAELLFRGCNAAVPVIDVGMDVFAFRDDREQIARIQVKAAQGTPYQQGGGYRAQFNIPLEQLTARDVPPLYYVLAVRLEDQWASFLVVARRQLKQHWEGDLSFGVENRKSGDVALQLKYRPDLHDPDRMTVRCGDVQLDQFLNAWNQLPPFWPSSDATAAGESPEA
jgi:hypothetical protein